MDDSISSLALRQARRTWPVLLVAAVLGGLVAGALTVRRSQLSATQTVEVARVSEVAGLLQIGTITNVDVRQIAFQMAAEYDLTDLSEQVGMRLTPDTVADTVTLVATGRDEETVLEAMRSISDGLTQRATDPRVVEVDQAIATNDQVLSQIRANIEGLEAAIRLFDQNESGRDVVLINLVQTQTSLLGAETRAEGLSEYRRFLNDSLVRVGPVDIEEAPGVDASTILAGVIAALVLSAGVLFVFVALDRRVRRAIHLTRAAPGSQVVGILPRRPDPDSSQAELFRRSLRRTFEAHGVDQIAVVGASDTDSEQAVMSLIGGDRMGATSVFATSTELPDPAGQTPERTAVVIAAHFGTTPEDRVAAIAADLDAAGYGLVATCLTHVPSRDLDWARRRSQTVATELAHDF